jgi:ketosteroid isomerase-like protein
MDDQQKKDVMNRFIDAWTSGNIKDALSFLTDDCVLSAPPGTFTGIPQAEKYMTWVCDISCGKFKAKESGIGIVVQGEAAIIEQELSGVYKNEGAWVIGAICVYEFRDGKIAGFRTYYDTLSQAEQVAKGAVKLAVNAVVKGTREGL